MVEEKSLDVGSVAGGSPYRCPYGMGASCPLVEINKRVLRRRRWVSRLTPVAVGLVLTAVLVYFIHF